MNSLTISHLHMPEPVREMLHGIEVEDPFRWLEDQDLPATRSFIQAEQQTYTDYLGRHRELRGRIERRVRELLTVPAVELPVSDRHGGLLYLKREAQEEQCRGRKALEGGSPSPVPRPSASLSLPSAPSAFKCESHEV